MTRSRWAEGAAATLPLIGVSGQTRGSGQLLTCGFLLPASGCLEPAEDAEVSIPALRAKTNPESVNLIVVAINYELNALE